MPSGLLRAQDPPYNWLDQSVLNKRASMANYGRHEGKLKRGLCVKVLGKNVL